MVGREVDRRIERDELECLIQETRGAVRESARRLGWPESTFRYWLRRHGLEKRAEELRLKALWEAFKKGLGPDTPC